MQLLAITCVIIGQEKSLVCSRKQGHRVNSEIVRWKLKFDMHIFSSVCGKNDRANGSDRWLWIGLVSQAFG